MFFVDSGVWIGAFVPKDAHHEEALSVVKATASGKLDRVLTTAYIFNEVVTYVRRKIGAPQSIKVARALLDSENVKIVHVDEKIFNTAYHMFERYPRLSFTDAVTVVVMKDRGVEQLFSFDRGFDAVKDVRRLETIP
ncbi:MAG: hypothetical protein AVW06_04385 [Hadesarchaea archaeon DG-33-1]|nr:MAG: hypothetical protein AVW06_04385 [Hadesarchaea archaeon DG-33-1]